LDQIAILGQTLDQQVFIQWNSKDDWNGDHKTAFAQFTSEDPLPEMLQRGKKYIYASKLTKSRWPKVF